MIDTCDNCGIAYPRRNSSGEITCENCGYEEHD